MGIHWEDREANRGRRMPLPLQYAIAVVLTAVLLGSIGAALGLL